jgi:hypothetical protein
MISRAALKVALCLAALVWLAFPAAAQAQAVIKQPGNHPDYAVEIEPHLAFQWAGRYGSNDGVGPGARFNIPFMHNGPISTINNNMGISFGLDVTFGGGQGWCYNRYADRRFYAGYDCSSTEFWLPVAMQWNFWLTKVISVFGEPGFAIAHRRWSYDYCAVSGDLGCDQHYSSTDLDFIFGAGGRFMFSDHIGATVRIGYPMLTAGINFLL